MHSLLQDLKFAIRILVKSYGLTTIAVVTLALGIGANTAVFSLVDALLFKPLPYPEPDRLVNLWNTNAQLSFDKVGLTSQDFLDWQAETSSLADMGLYQYISVNVTGEGQPQRAIAVRSHANVLPIFGMPMAQGRQFSPEEQQPGQDQVVILTDRFWKSHFGGDPQVLGRTIALDMVEHTVIGVLPQEYSKLWTRVELWKPLALEEDQIERETHAYRAIARLGPSASLASAQAEMTNLASRLGEEHPKTNAAWDLNVQPIRDEIIDKPSQMAFVFLLFAVTFVLLIACTNVANLLLAKSSARQREMAIRSALGAGKWRIVRQLIAESCVLAFLGAVCGVLLAGWGLDILVASLPDQIDLKEDIRISERTLIFTTIATLGAVLLFGIMPALRASRVNLVNSLKEGSQSNSASGTKHRGRDLLVIGQISMAMALVLCTGLMVKSFLFTMTMDTNFKQDGMMTMRVTLPQYEYENDSEQVAFYDQVAQRIRALPGVQAATVCHWNPFQSNSQSELTIEGYQPPDENVKIWSFINEVDASYFETFQIPLIEGRFFTPQDLSDSLAVAIVSDALASRFWPDESAIEKRLKLGEDESWLNVVGVVPSTVIDLQNLNPHLEVMRPAPQVPGRHMCFVASTEGNPEMLVSSMQSAIWEIDANLPVYDVGTINQHMRDEMGAYGTFVGILLTLAGIALVLSCVGLYGIIAYTVQMRTREMGIRLALGAKAMDVLRLVLMKGVVITFVGVFVGQILALALATLLKSVMIGVTPTDPATYLVIGFVLVIVALMASYIPARRATKVDPMVALRYE